jgi:hypothetical protein
MVYLRGSGKKVKNDPLIKVRLLENHKDGMIGIPE